MAAASHHPRVLVVSTDPAHSLGDALGTELGHDPTAVAAGVDAAQLDPRTRLERSWADVRGYLVALLAWGGLDAVEAEELAVVPGLDELFALAEVTERAADGRWDLVVVDCAPTGETIRLLSLPDVLTWYVERLFPVSRRVMAAVRPVVSGLGGAPLPSQRAIEAIERLHGHLATTSAVLTDPARTSVRLVITPEALSLAEAQRTATSLALFGYHLDGVVVNRVIPPELDHPYMARWKEIQAAHIDAIDVAFGHLPIHQAPLFDDELLGVSALERMGASLWSGTDPVGGRTPPRQISVRTTPDGAHLHVPLPFAATGDVDLARRGEALVLRVGSHTRSVALPVALARAQIRGAGITDGDLVVRFAPDAATEAGPDGG